MKIIHLFVTLKISDNTARTALHAVRTRLGYSQLEFLRRADLWEFQFSTLDEASMIQTVEDLVNRTAYFVNPNKHRWILKPTQQSIETSQQIESPFDANTSIAVYDHIDGKAESTFHAIQPLLAEGQHPVSLRRAVWWDLQFGAIEPDSMLKITQSLAVSTTRQEGLFSNPHFQSCKIFRHA